MLRYIMKVRIKTALIGIISAVFLSAYFIGQLIITKEAGVNISDFPIILWWTPFMYESIKLINCEDRFQCILTKNRTFKQHSNMAAYLFYGSNFDLYDLPLPKTHIPWAIFHEESPKNLAFFLYHVGQKQFNITATFSRNSDFPVPLQFLKDLNQISDLTYYVPVSEKNKLLNNIAPVLYIQSDCDTPSERDNYVAELMKYINVDSYGACLNNKKLPEKYGIENVLEDLYDDTFMNLVAQYKFVIAIENSICNDYITEKLWRPIIVGSIPIYLGSPTVTDWLPNNNSAILIKDYKNIKALAEYIHNVNKNDRLYEKYMQHKVSLNEDTKVTNKLLKSNLQKGFYGIENNNDFPVPAFECFVCKMVHKKSYTYRSSEKSVYDCEEPTSWDTNSENWWKTHWKNGLCQAKTLQYFVDIHKFSNYTKDMFEQLLNEYVVNKDC